MALSRGRVNANVFRALLTLLGAVNIFLGLNVALGGFVTLGWLGPTDFLQVTGQPAYLVQDSHIRFYGGLYVALGLFLILAATDLRRYQTALRLAFALIFAGGLARFSLMRPDVLFGPKILGSLVVELVVMPVFALWLSKIMLSEE